MHRVGVCRMSGDAFPRPLHGARFTAPEEGARVGEDDRFLEGRAFVGAHVAVPTEIGDRTIKRKVAVETVALQGIEMAESLSEDGSEIVSRPYKWYSGTATADNKQMAIELAQREAYATISRVLNNTVMDNAERGNISSNMKVRQAIRSHWEQVSSSVSKACEPFGKTVIEYNPSTGMYSVTAKVGVRGDIFFDLLEKAGKFEPQGLTQEELEQFIEENRSIMEAAKGN